jgi:hypothetical protein
VAWNMAFDIDILAFYGLETVMATFWKKWAIFQIFWPHLKWVNFCIRSLTHLVLLNRQMSSFKTWFVISILRFQKWFNVDALGFQIELICRYFDLFVWNTVWATFWKKWAIFSKVLVTLSTVKHWSIRRHETKRPPMFK